MNQWVQKITTVVKIGLILLKIAVSAYGIPLPIAGALEALSSENASNVLIDAVLVEVGGEAYKDLINQTVTKVKSKLINSSQTYIDEDVDIQALNNNNQHSAEETKQAYNEVLNLFQSQLKMTSELISMSCGLEKIIYRGY